MPTDPQMMQEYMDMQQQEQMQQQPMPMLAPQMPSEILELELNYGKTLDELEKKLKGEVNELDKETNARVWVRRHEPWMNNKGISKIIGIIRGHIDVNTFLTFLVDSEINQISWEISDEVTTILANKTNDFDIDPTYLGIIQSIIINNIFFALKRAQGALTLKQIHSTTTRIENPMQLEQARARERKGFLGRFF